MEGKLRMGPAGVSLLGFVLPALSGTADVQVRPEIHPIETVTLSLQQALLGGKDGKPAMVAGVLRIPVKPAGRIPAVILLHGGNGLTSSEERWAKEINSIGAATFLIDSFTGRGIRPANDDREELATLTMLADAYRALGMLAKDQRIDSSQIAVMGFSMGAAAAVYASMERFRAMYAPPGLQFAAHVGLYTPCYWHFRENDRVTGKPIRLFHGTSDDWVPIAPCQAYVEHLRKAGVDITLAEYAGAYHGYDSIEQRELRWVADGASLRDCELVEGDGGVILEGKTGKSFHILSDPCVKRGAHVGYNEAAATATVNAVKEFLITIFQFKP
jgi:dienelactone hydrolase